jgi:phosphoserine phosphatase RsbU/P
MNVLVVDDDAVLRKLLQAMMVQLGHTVSVAASGAEAWRLFSAAPSPLVLTDWMMDDVDGLELCRRIRSRPTTPYTYVILLTSKDAAAHYTEGIEAGADDFLGKPVDRNLLAARVHVARRILGLRDHVEDLERLLPICMYCKKIRNPDDSWLKVEEFITTRTSEQLTHGICPHCYETVARPAIARALRERQR